MKQIIANLLALGRTRLLILGGVGIGFVAVLLLGLSMVTAPNFRPLYTQLSPASAASVVDALKAAGIDTKVSSDGSAVSVPRPDLSRARMALAQKGLPTDGAPGWELFDKTSVLGMDSFMQRINRLRAMEGELARSIETLDGVRSARVHLVLPQREAFATTAPDPSASVIVRADPNRTVSRRQALAIRNLIAAAVANMAPDRVVVLSARGDTILAENSNGMDGGASLQSTKAAIEDRMARSIEQILSARVGAGNARVQVAVTLDHARQVVVQQSYDPNQQVVRQTATRSEKAQDSKNSNQVGVTANLPPAIGGGNSAAGTTNASTKSTESITYDIGNTRSETSRAPGAIKHLSVAVLVNGIYDNKNGTVKYRARTPQELARLTKLVESAVGYDKARGDTVSVDSMRFVDYSMDLGAPQSPGLMQRLTANAVPILRWLIGLALVAVASIFGLRPAIARLLEGADRPAEPPAAVPAPEAHDALAPPAGTALQAGGTNPAGGGGAAKGGQGLVPATYQPHPGGANGIARHRPPLHDAAADEFIDTLSIHGTQIKRRVEAIRHFVDEEPNEAMKVLRSWLVNEA